MTTRDPVLRGGAPGHETEEARMEARLVATPRLSEGAARSPRLKADELIAEAEAVPASIGCG